MIDINVFKKGPVASTIDNIMEHKEDFLENIKYVEHCSLKNKSKKITSYSKIFAIFFFH